MFSTPHTPEEDRKTATYNGKKFDLTGSYSELKTEIAAAHGARVARQAVSHMVTESLYHDIEQCIRVAAQNIKETDEYLGEND